MSKKVVFSSDLPATREMIHFLVFVEKTELACGEDAPKGVPVGAFGFNEESSCIEGRYNAGYSFWDFEDEGGGGRRIVGGGRKDERRGSRWSGEGKKRRIREE